MPNTQKISATAYLICGLASLFYVYDFIIRIIPGTIAAALMAQYQISAAGLGLLSSFFFLGYMLMQVPCGLLYDRFGPRKLLTITTLVASLATFFFIATTDFAVASIARFFMGLGAAFAYIGPLVLASRWLPARHFALTAGLIQLLGSLGAIIGEAPIAALVMSYGAYRVITFVALIGLVLAVAFWLLIQDFPKGQAEAFADTHYNEWERLRSVLRNTQNWAAAVYGFTIWAPISIFASLWAVPYLATRYDGSIAHAAGLASFLWLGVGVGGPVFGWYSNYIESRRMPLIIGSIIGLTAALMILYLPIIPEPLMMLLLFLYGTAGSAQAVTFGLVQDNNVLQHTGTASGFNNMAIVLGGVLFQPLVGVLLKLNWDGSMANGINVYSLHDFRIALFILPVCFLLSLLVVLLMVRETRCKA